MARNSEQPDLMHQLFKAPEQEKATKDVNFKMRRSFSWDRAFFTSDGVLDAEELSSMIEGGGNDVKHQSRRIEEIESLEAKLFEESEASMKKTSGQSSIKMSSGERDSQEKDSRFSPKATQLSMTQTSKETGAISPCWAVPNTSFGSSTPMKTQTARSSPLSSSPGSSSWTNVKSSETLARRNNRSKSGKTKAGSPSKTSPGIGMKNKVLMFSKLSPRTSPARPISPGSSGSSASTSTVNQRSSRGSSIPRRSSVNNEKLTPTDARKKDDQKIGKPTAGSVPNKPSNIGLKNKPPPVICHPSLPLGLRNTSPSASFTSSIISQRPSESSLSTTCAVDQRSISRGSRGSVHHRTLNDDASSKSTLKNQPSRQTPDQNQKQPSALCPQTGSISQPPIQSTGRGMPSPKFGFYEEGNSYKSRLLAGLPKTDATQESKTGSSNSAKARKLPSPKTVANHASLKPNSPRSTTPRPSREQASAKAKSSSNASRGVKNLLLVSPEVLDIKGKLNALKMEISMQKNSKSKMNPAEIGKGESSSSISSHHPGTYKQSSKIDMKNCHVPKKGNDVLISYSRPPFAVKNAIHDAKDTDKSR